MGSFTVTSLLSFAKVRIPWPFRSTSQWIRWPRNSPRFDYHWDDEHLRHSPHHERDQLLHQFSVGSGRFLSRGDRHEYLTTLRADELHTYFCQFDGDSTRPYRFYWPACGNHFPIHQP